MRVTPLIGPTLRASLFNEFWTPGLVSQAFPTLFPYGKGDPTCIARQRQVSLSEGFKHLIRYADVVDGAFWWRFASHPRFPYWALNMNETSRDETPALWQHSAVAAS